MPVAKTKRRNALNHWLPTVAEALNNVINDTRTAARMETAELLMDIEQVSNLFSSLEEQRCGQIVSMKSAFGDL